MVLKQVQNFQRTVWGYYAAHQRNLPWRKAITPYRVWLSEVMLQQTQVPRVIIKYQEFLKKFSSVQKLAVADFKTVLALWSGLGYNRRAKFLHQAAQQLAVRKTFPKTIEEWEALPGIGHATAAAIMAYAYNQPVVYIETNIRSVFLHEFFPGREQVPDTELIPIIEAALDRSNPREWYWALMDYGTYIKSQQINPSRRSKQYAKQSTFKGSLRELRGNILKELLKKSSTFAELRKKMQHDELLVVLAQLEAEHMIVRNRNRYAIR